MNAIKDLGAAIGRTQALLALLLAAAVLPATVQAADAPLRVTASVARHASIRMAPPPSLTISEADLARGYVEVAAPLELAVQSNVSEGYTLNFQHAGEQVRQSVVQGLAGALAVGPAGATASRPAAGAGMWRETLQLRVRFDLSPQARVGVHPWPLQVSMMSL
jgi:hypothetical protein